MYASFHTIVLYNLNTQKLAHFYNTLLSVSEKKETETEMWRERGEGERGRERERERETETEHLHELYGVSVVLDPRGLVGAWEPDV